MDKVRILHAAPYRTGGKLYRVIIHRYTQDEKLLGTYEVWVTLEGLKSRSFGLDNDNPLPSQLSAFATHFYEERLKQTNYELKETGAFITEDGVTYGDANTFSDEMLAISRKDSYVQTNISLPNSLHEWLKLESAKSKKSLSEIIRQVVLQYKENTFICSTCGKEKQGNPFFETGDPDYKKDCYECFLKAFEV